MEESTTKDMNHLRANVLGRRWDGKEGRKSRGGTLGLHNDNRKYALRLEIRGVSKHTFGMILSV